MVVYIDVLFIVNLIINYFILLAVTQLLKRNDKRWRLLLGALVGALYSCLLFFPELQFLFSAVLKLFFSAVIVAVSYKFFGVRNFFKLLLYFYIVSMLFGGIIYAIQLFFAPPLLLVKNGVAYLDISPLFLIVTSAIAYVVINLFSKFLHQKIQSDKIYSVKAVIKENSVNFRALLDTGNSLKDTLSGSPIMVAEFASVKNLIPKEIQMSFKNSDFSFTDEIEKSSFKNRFRIVPYSSVGSTNGILPAFKPDRIVIEESSQITDVIVAVTSKKLSPDGNYTALISPLLVKSQILSTERKTAKRELLTQNKNGDDSIVQKSQKTT